MKRRHGILKENQAMREGIRPGARKLDHGEVTFRIPVEDWPALRMMYPDIESKDHDVRLAAWKALAASPIGEKYLVVRTPRQVRRSAK